MPREFCGQSPIASDDVSLKRWIIYNCHCMTVIWRRGIVATKRLTRHSLYQRAPGDRQGRYTSTWESVSTTKCLVFSMLEIYTFRSIHCKISQIVFVDFEKCCKMRMCAPGKVVVAPESPQRLTSYMSALLGIATWFLGRNDFLQVSLRAIASAPMRFLCVLHT